MHIERLELISPELAAMKTFYGDVLGLPIAAAGEKSLEIQVGVTRLVFCRSAFEGEGRYHFAFNIPENQWEAGREWLAQRVTLYSDPANGEVFPFPDWNAHALYFYDPVGNVLEFIARHDLPNTASSPFDSDQILCVSEIGIAAESVSAMVEELRTRVGVELYRPGSDTFAPVGDENGLFIVVPAGREWFPNTGIRAASLPTTVHYRIGESGRGTITL